MKDCRCITCEMENSSRKKKAKHFVEVDGVELGFCDEHYKEYLAQEEFSINLTDLYYGDTNFEDREE